MSLIFESSAYFTNLTVKALGSSGICQCNNIEAVRHSKCLGHLATSKLIISEVGAADEVNSGLNVVF